VRLQLLTDNPAQGALEVSTLLLNMLAQGSVDKRLAVCATSSVYLLAKPVENDGVDPAGDAVYRWAYAPLPLLRSFNVRLPFIP
jgi:hypothetical protein